MNTLRPKLNCRHGFLPYLNLTSTATAFPARERADLCGDPVHSHYTMTKLGGCGWGRTNNALRAADLQSTGVTNFPTHPLYYLRAVSIPHLTLTITLEHPKTWKSYGESNPASQDENLMS